MRGEIPKDTDVMLEQPQIHTQRIVVIQVAESPAVRQLADLADGAGEEECVVHHDCQILPSCKFNELFRLCRVRGKRLLNKYVFPIFESQLSQFVVSPNGRDY